MILETNDLMSYVQDDPVKECTKQIAYQTLILDQSECKVVFIVAKYPVETFISVVFVVDWVIQDLERAQNNCVE